MTNEVQLDAVTEAVAEQHSKLLSLPQPVAECWYIVEAQHLDGYGQERFLAKVHIIHPSSCYKFASYFILLTYRKSRPARPWWRRLSKAFW